MVAHFFRLSNQPAMTFAEQLTDTTALTQSGCQWYEWDKDVLLDAVCGCCGAVEPVGHTELEGCSWLCADCAKEIV